MVIWLSGLSGAGKTTIAEAVVLLVKPKLGNIVLIDGDIVRELFGATLAFDEESRVIQINRIQRLAKWLSGQGLPVVVAALFCREDLMKWNRENLPGYYEVYVDAPLELLRGRDPKGLYAKAQRGEVDNVVGIDVPWYPPEKPHLTIDALKMEPVKELARRIVAHAPGYADIFPQVDRSK